MPKALLDTLVIVGGLFIGGVVAVLDNPLTASVIFLIVLGGWELARFLPGLAGDKRNQQILD